MCLTLPALRIDHMSPASLLLHPAQQHEGTAHHGHMASGPVEPRQRVGGVERSHPAPAIWAARQREAQRLVVCVEEDEERVVAYAATAVIGGRDLLAVQEDRQRAREAVLPVLEGHLPPVGLEPGDVGQLFAVDLTSLEPAPSTEDRVVAAELDQASHERRQVAVVALPVEPGGGVVLTVGVVVASLGSTDVASAEQQQ